MLPKKGSGGDHVTDPIIALVVLMVSHPPWCQVLIPRVPHVLREVVSLPSPTTSNYTNPTSPLEDTIQIAPSSFDIP